MAKESVHKKKERVRPPRVHISYDVEKGDATVQKELPFVLGVLSDLAGNPEEPLPGIRDRKFTEIDRDNFDDVMKSIKPRITTKVPNRLADDDSELALELNFRKMDDFRPENVARQIKPLADLLEIRNQLKDLLGRTEGNDRLESLLGAILENQDARKKLEGVFQGGEASASGEGEPETPAEPPEGETPPKEGS